MKSLKWLEQHPWTVVSFGSGLLVGVLLCLPILPFELPDSAASLIGSLVGALVAIGGAVWVAAIPERKKLRAFQAQLMEQSLSVTLKLNRIELQTRHSPINTSQIPMVVKDSRDTCAIALQKLMQLEGRAVESGVGAMAMRRKIMKAIEKADQELIALANRSDLLPIGYSNEARRIRETVDSDVDNAFR